MNTTTIVGELVMFSSQVLRAPAVTRRKICVCPLLVVFAMLMSFPVKADSDTARGSDQILSSLPVVTSSTCGRGCRCSHNATVANCSYANLAAVPQFPTSTRALVLDWNHIGRLGDSLGASPTSAGNGTTSSRLELVSVSHNNVSEIAATALRGLGALHQLRLDNNHIKRLPATIFADTPSLGAMSLASNSHLDMTSVGAALAPTRLPLLRHLDLSKIDTVTVDGRLPETVFSQLPALEHLVLRYVTIANVSAEFFAALSGTCLTTLDLTGSSIREVNDTAFGPIAESLEQLILDRAIISPRGLDAVFAGLTTASNNTRLLSLSLKNVFVEDAHDAAVGQHLFRHLITSSRFHCFTLISATYRRRRRRRHHTRIDGKRCIQSTSSVAAGFGRHDMPPPASNPDL